jgi:uncharacterized protein YciI
MRTRLLILAAALAIAATPAAAQSDNAFTTAPPRSLQFVIVLRPAPRLVEPANWTPEDERVVAEHFMRLQRLRDSGQVLLAGRTLNDDAGQFGLVIVEVASEPEAREIMEGDPAVKAGVMSGELFPYSVALQRLSREAGTARE